MLRRAKRGCDYAEPFFERVSVLTGGASASTIDHYFAGRMMRNGLTGGKKDRRRSLNEWTAGCRFDVLTNRHWFRYRRRTGCSIGTYMYA